MSEPPLSPEILRRAHEELSQVPASEASTVASIVGEALLDQAQHRAAAVSLAVVDARVQAAHASSTLATTRSGRPLEILRGRPRDAPERALLAVLLARHLSALLARKDGVHAVRALLPSLDWLEFDGLTPAYSALREVLSGDARARFEELLRGAPAEGATALAIAATRALRGVPEPTSLAPLEPSVPAPPPMPVPKERARSGAPLSIAGEVEGFQRALPLRVLSTLVGWSFLRGSLKSALRVVFSLRAPATLTLDGDLLRVVGHKELLGRTLRTFDVRYPLANLLELRREARFPGLPAAASVLALSLGAILGAKTVVEGAREVYFPLIALGLGLLAGGLLFDFVLRALFPGVKGRVRLVVRAKDERAVVLTELPLAEVDKLLAAVDGRFVASPARVRALEVAPPPEPERDPAPEPRSAPEARRAGAGRG